MLTIEVAKRLRIERGLYLPVGCQFETPELERIAKRQAELVAELTELDQELLAM